MHRLRGFDYKRPFFYMVTLKRLPRLAAFSQIAAEDELPKDAQGLPRYLVPNEIPRAFARVIRHFHEKWWGLWPIDCFAIMPDHIHLLIHIKDSGDQMALGKYVYQLMKALAVEYWRRCGATRVDALVFWNGLQEVVGFGIIVTAIGIKRIKANEQVGNRIGTGGAGLRRLCGAERAA